MAAATRWWWQYLRNVPDNVATDHEIIADKIFADTNVWAVTERRYEDNIYTWSWSIFSFNFCQLRWWEYDTIYPDQYVWHPVWHHINGLAGRPPLVVVAAVVVVDAKSCCCHIRGSSGQSEARYSVYWPMRGSGSVTWAVTRPSMHLTSHAESGQDPTWREDSPGVSILHNHTKIIR